jgi:hypothetical protein
VVKQRRLRPLSPGNDEKRRDANADPNLLDHDVQVLPTKSPWAD